MKENPQTWDTAQIEQTVKFMFSNVASRPTVYKTGLFAIIVDMKILSGSR